MFAPHTAQVEIARTEPIGINAELAAEIVRKRNATLAFEAVSRDMLKVNQTTGQIITARLIKRWETDERLKSLRPFVDSWNYWRERYAKHDYEFTWVPKTPSQISMMETVNAICQENQIDTDIFIACGHRAYAKSRYSLSLNMLCANGLDFFAKHAEEVLTEIDEDAYQRKAADEWRLPDED